MFNLNKPLNLLLVLICIFFQSGSLFAQWHTTIKAEREQSQPFIEIGVDLNAHSDAAAPEPPDFKCHMNLITMPDYNTFSEIVYKKGSPYYQWILAINPHGYGEPITQTSKLSWLNSEFGPGKFKLVEGTDKDGKILVDNMKSTSFINISGNTDKYLYYSLINEPGIDDLIQTVKMISGIDLVKPIFLTDLNNNGKTELADCIHMIKYLAQLDE